MADYRDELAAAQARNDALEAQNEAMRAENDRLRFPEHQQEVTVTAQSPAGKRAAIATSVLLVAVLLVTIAALVSFATPSKASEAELLAGVLGRNETLRTQVCQRQTAEIGQLGLESLSRTTVPGHDEQVRATANVSLHPPGMPICRASVRFDYEDVRVESSRRGRWTMTAIIEVQVGSNAPIEIPINVD